jgi:hypothetical protein
MPRRPNAQENKDVFLDSVLSFEAFGEKGPSLVVIPIDYRENALLTKKLGEITCTI